VGSHVISINMFEVEKIFASLECRPNEVERVEKVKYLETLEEVADEVNLSVKYRFSRTWIL
jgi:hypothetical protein